MMISIRNERYKYCFARYESTEELYDMYDDPHEINNLANNKSYRDILEKMRNDTNNWCLQNNHEPVIDTDGKLTYSKFILSEHQRLPHQVLGIRPC